MRSNIFDYATSELSQDAFICWLLTHASKDEWNTNPKLREYAVRFIREIVPDFHNDESEYVSDLHHEFLLAKEGRKRNFIDVLVELKKDDGTKRFIIIEDKTYTDANNKQIQCYKDLLQARYPQCDIYTAAYKSSVQDMHGLDVNKTFDRDDLIEIFKDYDDSESEIIKTYVTRLQEAQRHANQWRCKNPEEWDFDMDCSLFKYLMEKSPEIRATDTRGWGYRNTPGGADNFYCLYWFPDTPESGLPDWMRLYGHLENYYNYHDQKGHVQICIKINTSELKDKTLLRTVREQLLAHVKTFIPTMDKCRWRSSKNTAMVCRCSYTLENVEDLISSADIAMRSFHLV